MSTQYDVVIAGGGPVGLFLSCELASTGAAVVVLEREIDPKSPWKQLPLGVRGINTRSVESLYRRGLLQELEESAKAGPVVSEMKFLGHFGGILFDGAKFDRSRFPYVLEGPSLAARTTSLDSVEAVLAERARELGVEIRRGRTVTSILSQDKTSVTVEASVQGNHSDGVDSKREEVRGRWLVGCDGGRSFVRKAAGFEFVGTEPRFTVYSIQGEIENIEKLKQGFAYTSQGLYVLPPPTGWGQLGIEHSDGKIIHLMDGDGGAFDRSQELSLGHLQEVLERVTERQDVRITKVSRARTFTDRTKQTTQYRRGRIFLAGDASHIHPPLGGQGLNLGLEDAINLGWKLGAAIRREKKGGAEKEPEVEVEVEVDALLSTYEQERKPFGTMVMEYTRAQAAALVPDEHGRAVRTILKELIDTRDGVTHLVGRAWGLANRYPLSNSAGEGEGVSGFDHPVIGRSVPDFVLADGSRFGPLMARSKGLLVHFDFEDKPEQDGKSEIACNSDKLRALLEGGEGFKERVEYLSLRAKPENTCGLAAFLVRPDGIVAWAVDKDSELNYEAAKEALGRWLAF
ncbi:putative pentachlorophenol 4-monooxygenase [Xylariaceae sp. FL0594]|nr:putative pentachlorophenol 4-monooxygenase [Xylariaceae sp. FL0594]